MALSPAIPVGTIKDILYLREIVLVMTVNPGSSDLIDSASFVACHQFTFLERQDLLRIAAPGATFLLNSAHGAESVWDHLPRSVQKQIIDKRLKFHVIDASKAARDAGLPGLTNTILQTCFFALSGVLPRADAIEQIKKSIRKTYARKGEAVVLKNFAAVDGALAKLYEVRVPREVTSTFDQPPIVPKSAPAFVQSYVLASARDVNVLVLDTEVYSNTGGQASKATPLGAVAKFAAAGKRTARKDLALQAIAYGNVYVAQVAMGANPQHTLDAFREAEAYPGPSLILAYSHCIAHGIDMRYGMRQQDLAVASGYWPLFRFNPARRNLGENPFRLDSPRPTIPFKAYAQNEIRYTSLAAAKPKDAEQLMAMAQEVVTEKYRQYEDLAASRPGRFHPDAHFIGKPVEGA